MLSQWLELSLLINIGEVSSEAFSKSLPCFKCTDTNMGRVSNLLRRRRLVWQEAWKIEEPSIYLAPLLPPLQSPGPTPSVHLIAWTSVTVTARSRRLNEKIGNCNQSSSAVTCTVRLLALALVARLRASLTESLPLISVIVSEICICLCPLVQHGDNITFL